MSRPRTRHLQSPSLLASTRKLNTDKNALSNSLKRTVQTGYSNLQRGARMTQLSFMQLKDPNFNRYVNMYIATSPILGKTSTKMTRLSCPLCHPYVTTLKTQARIIVINQPKNHCTESI